MKDFNQKDKSNLTGTTGGKPHQPGTTQGDRDKHREGGFQKQDPAGSTQKGPTPQQPAGKKWEDTRK